MTATAAAEAPNRSLCQRFEMEREAVSRRGQGGDLKLKLTS